MDMNGLITAMLLLLTPEVNPGTDVYIKLNDTAGKHQRISSVSYPGGADNLDMYNSIYGHGAVIENPWVAFRVYMDNRQSLDLYVKQTPRLELEETGFYTTPVQLSEGYGRDVLWAGKSIAAGSFRGFQNGSPVTIDSVAERGQRVIYSSAVEVTDKGWIYNGHRIDMTQIYKVRPDSRNLWVEISLEGAAPDDLFCVGIQKLETDNVGFIKKKGVAASWGRNVPDKEVPEISEQVGLALRIDPSYIVDVKTDELNYLFIVRPDKNGKIRYEVIACGDREKNGYKESGQWFDAILSDVELTR